MRGHPHTTGSVMIDDVVDPIISLEKRCHFSVAPSTSSIFLGPEEEERSEHPEDQVREESECRKVDVEFSVVCADGENLEDGEDADSKDVDRPHIEVVSLIDLAQLAYLLGVEVFLTGAVPEHVLDVKGIAVRRFEEFSSVELGINDVQSVVLKEIVDQLDCNWLRQRFQFDLREGCPDTFEEEVLLHLYHGCANESDIQKRFEKLLLSRRNPVQVIEED